MNKKRGFTLLELLIVMVILGILFVLLLRTYNWISTVVFRVQQEKEIAQEVLQISHIVQNFADRNTIDYDAYGILSENNRFLVDTQGITDVLYLSGLDGNVKLYTQGNCIDPGIEYSFDGIGSGCLLLIDVGGKTRSLINSSKVIISKVVFKVIPFAAEQHYLYIPGLCETGHYLQCLNTPGFWMIFTVYSAHYGPSWATRVRVPFQQFF